jgi:toxin ParE1/3/4
MTGHDYRFRPQAHDDVIALAQHIASDHLPAAERFLDAVEATCALIAELPRSGAARPFKHPALTGMRMMRVHGFEAYLIFYLTSETGVDVVRVVHGARDLPTLFS